MFQRLRIPPELLAEAHVRRVSDAEARDLMGIGKRAGDMAGIVYDYPDPNTGHVVARRLRRDNPEFENGKPKDKYISTYGGLRRLYFPPGTNEKLRDPETAVVLVEAEKSALAGTAFAQRSGGKLLFVATGGCYSWRGRVGKIPTPNGYLVDEKGPSKDLRCCNGRKVIILFDANATTNAEVRQAQNDLVRVLTNATSVFVASLPLVDGVNGPDDYIAVCGEDALAKVLDSARPAVASCDYGGGCFEIRGKQGVYYVPAAAEDGEPKPPLWMCSPLAVLAMTRDDKSGEWGRLLTWWDSDGVRHEWAMPMELLQRDGGVEVRCELARQGLSIAPGRAARELLTTYLQIWPVEARARCVDRLGWHGAVYVLPGEAIGDSGETVVFQNAHAVEPAFAIAGNLEEWRTHVAALAEGNSRMVFAISAAFAGTLLEPAGEDSGGFHLRGPSSTGKSTALQCAGSVWGYPGKDAKSYCRSWRATTNGLEGLAALHNDALLILDELGEMDAQEAGEAAYLLANGRGKARASRTGTARQSASWRLLFLSAGEPSLSALMAQAGKKPTAGQEIRLAEIDADAGAGMGAIEALHSYDGPGALVAALRDAAAKYYGTVGAEWLRLVVRDRNKLPAVLADGIRRFVEEFAPKNAGGQIERVARRFGLVAMAGEIATRYDLTGWQEGEASAAVGKCFTSWLDLFGAGSREERKLLAQVRAFFEHNGASRFQDVASENQQVINRAGFYRGNDDGAREYLVLPEAFKADVCAGFDTRYAASVLREHGWLLTGNDKLAQRVRLPGIGPSRVYVFGARVWEDE
jgi:uncharacterized protein (DUF927 family)